MELAPEVGDVCFRKSEGGQSVEAADDLYLRCLYGLIRERMIMKMGSTHLNASFPFFLFAWLDLWADIAVYPGIVGIVGSSCTVMFRCVSPACAFIDRREMLEDEDVVGK